MSAHADLLKLLLPPLAYDKSGIALSAEILAEGVRLDAFESFAEALLVETDPRTTEILLADWERVYGLPGACSGAGTTIEERRAYLMAKVAETGGLTKSYFLNLAAALGYVDTTITTFRPIGCESSCEGPVVDEPWRFVWFVNLPHEGDNYSQFRADSICTTAVDFYLTGLLECVFMRLKPADGYVIFTYE
jgi:uncharacterized protein YmfQ (DUF2313 family)